MCHEAKNDHGRRFGHRPLFDLPASALWSALESCEWLVVETLEARSRVSKFSFPSGPRSVSILSSFSLPRQTPFVCKNCAEVRPRGPPRQTARPGSRRKRQWSVTTRRELQKRIASFISYQYLLAVINDYVFGTDCICDCLDQNVLRCRFAHRGRNFYFQWGSGEEK